MMSAAADSKASLQIQQGAPCAEHVCVLVLSKQMVWHIKRSIFWFRKHVWGSLGPGLITGAADDDPSGIATYSIAGAQLGTRLLWTALITWPLMAAVQMMCARIGMVSGRGLTAAFKTKFPRWLVTTVITALLVANTINVDADLAGMVAPGGR